MSIILAVIGISFSLRSERSGGIAQGIGAGLVIGFSYWLVYAFGMSLGRSGTLPPFIAAWFANILFGVASLFLDSAGEDLIRTLLTIGHRGIRCDASRHISNTGNSPA